MFIGRFLSVFSSLGSWGLSSLFFSSLGLLFLGVELFGPFLLLRSWGFFYFLGVELFAPFLPIRSSLPLELESFNPFLPLEPDVPLGLPFLSFYSFYFYLFDFNRYSFSLLLYNYIYSSELELAEAI